MHVCAHMHTWCLQRSKETLAPLELEILMAVNHHVGAGNPVLVHCKNNECS